MAHVIAPPDLTQRLPSLPPLPRFRDLMAVSFGFLPNLTPRAIALARPSPVLVMIRLRSNSANPPRTVSINLPCGVVVSAHASHERPEACLPFG